MALVPEKAFLIFESGQQFVGYYITPPSSVVGEVVFNTATTGYQEVITDPSYCRQLVTFTAPHIGNVGVNTNDMESARPWCGAVIMRAYNDEVKHWRSEESLVDLLQRHNVVAIAGLDTRSITHMLREHGVMWAMITPQADIASARLAIQQAKLKVNRHLIYEVTTPKPYFWQLQAHPLTLTLPLVVSKARVLVLDYGVKYSTLRLLASAGLEVLVLPARTSIDKIKELNPAGIVLSNGPGDPRDYSEAVASVQQLIQTDYPILAICLGCQLLALAQGASIYKMRFGQHGINHPVLSLDAQRVLMTSQNHAYAIDEESLPKQVAVTHRSLFDGSVQGIAQQGRPHFAVQGHPEAGPGPSEWHGLLNQFLIAVAKRVSGQATQASVLEE